MTVNFQIMNSNFSRKTHPHPELLPVQQFENVMNTFSQEVSAIDHDHDDTYYTESEVDGLLDGKSDIGHIHDDRYYTESEVDALLQTLGSTAPLYFKAWKTTAQSIAANAWTTVNWQSQLLLPATGFSPSTDQHNPNSAQEGLWLYSLIVAVTSEPAQFFAAIWKNGSLEALLRTTADVHIGLTTPVIVQNGDSIDFRVYSGNAVELDINIHNCQVSGTRLGPVPQ